jgi:hypothetical protein
MDMGVKIILGEEELYGLCKQYSDKAKGIVTDDDATESLMNRWSQPFREEISNQRLLPPRCLPVCEETKSLCQYQGKSVCQKTTSNPYASKPNETESSLSKSPPDDPNALWADKDAPKSTRDILGNQDSVKKLATLQVSSIWTASTYVFPSLDVHLIFFHFLLVHGPTYIQSIGA